VPRISPVTTKEEVGPDREYEIDAITAIFGQVGGPSAMLMHVPGLAPMVSGAGVHLRSTGLLTVAEREVAILAVAREKDAGYAWAAHVGVARDEGVDDSTLNAIRDRGELSEIEDGYRDIVDFVRQLLRTNRIADDLFDRMRTGHGERWMVELTAVIGHYQYIGSIIAVFEVEPPDGAEQLPI
jgi:4-carboxymuconolactone decarboxylase